mgnify:CR=1 FL=1
MNELDINNPQLPDFIVPGADEKKQDEPAKIKVIGVGGGGGNAVNHMYHQGIGGVSFVLCNTDAQALRNSPVPVKVQLGAKGEGAGNIPEVAKKLAEESAAEVEALFDDNTRVGSEMCIRDSLYYGRNGRRNRNGSRSRGCPYC